MRLRRGAKKSAPESVPAPQPTPTPLSPAPQHPDSLVYELLANVALRDLTVIERILSTISDVERGEQDPERLSLYYALDHDVTRLRRSAENALVLAGAQAPMGRSEPMSLLDVARAAASESADYTRVSVGQLPPVAVGPAVADDLAHTLAELMDNALSVSPSRARVSVTGARASGGVLVTVEDEGIGIAPDRLPDLNLRLTGPLVLDGPSTRQMGLYVVAHLARRHGIYVQLQSRRQLGSTAVAFLPDRLLLEAAATVSAATAPRAPRPPQGFAPEYQQSANGLAMAGQQPVQAGTVQATLLQQPGMAQPARPGMAQQPEATGAGQVPVAGQQVPVSHQPVPLDVQIPQPDQSAHMPQPTQPPQVQPQHTAQPQHSAHPAQQPQQTRRQSRPPSSAGHSSPRGYGLGPAVPQPARHASQPSYPEPAAAHFPPQQPQQARRPQQPRSQQSPTPRVSAAESAPPPVAPATVDRWAPTAQERAQPQSFTAQGLPRRTRPATPRAFPGPAQREARPADPDSVLADLDAFASGTADALGTPPPDPLGAADPQRAPVALPPAPRPSPPPPPLLTDPAQEDF